MTTESTPRYWSVPEVAALLGIHADKVTTWLRRGEIVGVNVAARHGRRPRWRIADAELQRFLRARQSAATPTTTQRQKRRDPADVVFFKGGRPVGATV